MGKSSGGIRGGNRKERYNAAVGGSDTIEDLERSINVEKAKKEDKERYNTFEDMTDAQIKESILYANTSKLIKDASKSKLYQNINGTSINNSYSYEITNDKVLDMFREVYKITPNKFVKSVISTVGQKKKFSDKQLYVILDEIIKIKTLKIKF